MIYYVYMNGVKQPTPYFTCNEAWEAVEDMKYSGKYIAVCYEVRAE